MLALPQGQLQAPSVSRIVFIVLLIGSLWSLPVWKEFIQKGLKTGTYSDLYRQWLCCQYVRAGENPFAVAEAALVNTYGPVQGPDRILLRDTIIWSVNMTEYDGLPGLLPGHPPPEAGYPPSSLAILLVIFGYLPDTIIPYFWMAVNMAAFLLLIWFLACPPHAAPDKKSIRSFLFLGALFLIWPTTRMAFASAQFSIVALLCALLGIQYGDRHPWIASVLFSLSLIKPAFTMLFLLIPLLNRNWRIFVGIAAIHGFGTLLISWMVRTDPWTLMMQWMNICRYLLQGAYTFQEIYNALAWENTWISTVLTLGIFAYAAGFFWYIREDRTSLTFSFLCFANMVWTYHERHDFTILIIPLVAGILLWIRSTQTRKETFALGAWILLYSLIGLALTDTAYADTLPVSKGLRWAGRISMWAVLAWVNVGLALRAHRHRRLKADPEPSH